MQLGEENPRTRRQAERGTRPRALADLRTKSAPTCAKAGTIDLVRSVPNGPVDRLRKGDRGHVARRHGSTAASP